MTVGWLRWFALGLTLAVASGATVGMAVDVFGGGWQFRLSIASAVVVVCLAVHIAWRLARARVLSNRSLDRALLDRSAAATGLPASAGGSDPTPDVRLVRALTEVEGTASDVLAGDRGNAPRGLLMMRLMLNDAGYWTTEDVMKFDGAVRVRNAVVQHGAWAVPARKVAVALRDLADVGNKLRPASAPIR